MTATVKVVLKGKSYKAKSGDVVDVDADTARQLIAEGHAVKTPGAKKKD